MKLWLLKIPLATPQGREHPGWPGWWSCAERRRATWGFGILDRFLFGVFEMRLDDDVWCHVVMVPCTQGIPDDKLWWRWWLQNQNIDFVFEQTTCPIPHAHKKSQPKLSFSILFLLLLSPYIRKNEKSSTMIRIDIYLKPSITAVVGWIQPPLISKWSKFSTFTEMQHALKVGTPTKKSLLFQARLILELQLSLGRF